MEVSKTPLFSLVDLAGWRKFGKETYLFVGEVTNRLVGFWRFRTSNMGLMYRDSKVRDSVREDSSWPTFYAVSSVNKVKRGIWVDGWTDVESVIV